MFFEEPTAAYESLTARMKALAVVRPIVGLDSSKAKTERGWHGYRLAELALAAVDFVALSSDMGTMVRQEAVAKEVARYAALQVPEGTESEREAVGTWITERLINVEERDRAFRQPIGTLDEEGFSVRDFPFQILREVPDEVGRAALVVTEAAINVLLHAIDIDVASAQIAAEARLTAMLKRARIEDALQAALHARRQSLRYAKQLTDWRAAMQRSVRAISWADQVDEEVELALEHVKARSDAETAMQQRAGELLAITEDEQKRQQLIDLGAVLADCLDRHAGLTTLLMELGSEFRRQQDRQVFVVPALHTRVHLEDQLLRPVLELPIDTAIGPLAAFTRAAFGSKRPHVLYLPDFFAALCRVTEIQPLEPAVVQTDHEWDESADEPLFTAEQEQDVADILAGVPAAGVRLSSLLQQARLNPPGASQRWGTDQLVALRVQELFRNIPVSRLAEGRESVVAIDDGVELDDQRFGGSDFLVLSVRADPANATGGPPAARPIPSPRRPGAPAPMKDQV
ncbi:hypothetical protein [Streptomyces rubellomurinus]|uniref:Uncharacterized protein n=1 Tax=Streptomyces rubellomurinus (strain ATCC 31215) TaxID=359131 RepID=A0A0F2TMS2_STRR3|nr:hypothetical protein [Streptomyces rubellomurinus]KJS63816.1 hypothetical protein VM95_00845 [Streptomyces rubellomurinus]